MCSGISGQSARRMATYYLAKTKRISQCDRSECFCFSPQPRLLAIKRMDSSLEGLICGSVSVSSLMQFGGSVRTHFNMSAPPLVKQCNLAPTLCIYRASISPRLRNVLITATMCGLWVIKINNKLYSRIAFSITA